MCASVYCVHVCVRVFFFIVVQPADVRFEREQGKKNLTDIHLLAYDIYISISSVSFACLPASARATNL